MRFAVISYDAGVSEVLCAFILAHYDKADWKVLTKIDSPMEYLCKKYNITYSLITSPEADLSSFSPDALLFGTGWQDHIEFPYVHYCKQLNIPTLAFLDHWTSHLKRFGYPELDWGKNLGDFTVVHDEKAFSQAKELDLPNIIALPNYYLKNIIDNSRHIQPAPNNNLLFLSEPTEEVATRMYNNPEYWGFTQYTALEEILANFEKFGCEALEIRLHPSESVYDKYTRLLASYSHIHYKIYNAKEYDLIAQLLNAKFIIGFDTMALYIAGLLKKPLISFLPTNEREFFLPLPSYSQIRSINDLIPKHFEPLEINISDFGIDYESFTSIINHPRS